VPAHADSRVTQTPPVHKKSLQLHEFESVQLPCHNAHCNSSDESVYAMPQRSLQKKAIYRPAAIIGRLCAVDYFVVVVVVVVVVASSG
jgi:hypothetical protein